MLNSWLPSQLALNGVQLLFLQSTHSPPHKISISNLFHYTPISGSSCLVLVLLSFYLKMTMLSNSQIK